MSNKIQTCGDLVKDITGNYWYRDLETGLYFELSMLLRQNYGTEDDLNSAVDKENVRLKTPGYEYFCTLGAVPKQILLLVNSGDDKKLQPKTRLFVWDSAFKGKIGDEMPRYGAFTADFVWADNDKVYTQWDADNLAYRYPRTSTAPIVAPEEPGGGGSQEVPSTGQTVVSGSLFPMNSKISIEWTSFGYSSRYPIEIRIEPLESSE